MGENNVLSLQAIALLRRELSDAYKRRASWTEIEEIMQRLLNLYACLDIEALINDVA
jgi:hypothetical protein